MSWRCGRILVATMALAATPNLVQAQASAKRLEIAGFVGGMSLDQDLGAASNIYMSVTGAAASSDFGQLYGFRASWAFHRNIAVGFDLTRGTNPYGFSVEDQEIGTVALAGQFEAERLYYGASVIAQFPFNSGLVPYASFGVGQLETTPKNPIAGITAVKSTDWSFGGGVKYWLPPVPWLGFGFDVRYHTASEGVTFPGGAAGPKGTEFTLGGMVRLF